MGDKLVFARTPLAAVAIGFVLLAFVPAGRGQAPLLEYGVVAVDLEPITPTLQLTSFGASDEGPNGEVLTNLVYFKFLVKDMSIAPADRPAPGNFHRVTFEYEWVGGGPPDSEWSAQPGLHEIITTTTDAKPEERQIGLYHTALTKATTASVRVTANLTLTTRPEYYATSSEVFTARIYPGRNMEVRILTTDPAFRSTAPPNTFVHVPVTIQNIDLYPQKVHVTLQIDPGEGVDPTQIPITGVGTYYLGPLELRNLSIGFRTPKEQFWYYSVSLNYVVTVWSDERPGKFESTGNSLSVDGFYFSGQLLIIIPLLILLALLLLFLIVAGKRRFEERFLGKPLPPWRIPEERAALSELRTKDPKEYYRVRFFFMVEEYESALNWFHAYKHDRKSTLRKENKAEVYKAKAARMGALSLDRFDQRAERLKKRIARKQKRLELKRDAKTERLQGKLDQTFQRDFEKKHEKWEEKVAKLERKANKPYVRAQKKWAKQVEKIQRKWEKPFAKQKKKYEKALTKAREKYEKVVKREDKGTWKAWRRAFKEAERENEVRKREGAPVVPLPELLSKAVGPPELPEKFQEPEPPKLPAEPKRVKVQDLPPEPVLATPKLEDSKYARKARRLRRKSERKVARLGRKLDRLLARNERDRVRALAKADKKQRSYLRKSKAVIHTGWLDRILRRSPEQRELRAHRRYVKALARERVRGFEDKERARLDLMRVEAQRREAELKAQLIRDKASVGAGGASARSESRASTEEIARAHAESRAKLAEETRKSKERIAATRERVENELRAELATPATP